MKKLFLAVLDEGCPGMVPVVLSPTPAVPVFPARNSLVWSSSLILPFISEWFPSGGVGEHPLYSLALERCSSNTEEPVTCNWWEHFSHLYQESSIPKRKFFVNFSFFFFNFLNQALGSSSQNILRLVVWRGFWKWMEHWSQLVQSNLKLFEGLS